MEEANRPQENAAHTEHVSSPKKRNFFKQRSVQIGLGIALILLILGGGYFFVANRSQAPVDEEETASEEVVQSLSAEELGLSMEAKPDKKAVKILIEKAGDLKTIEYQVTYEADSTAQEKAEGGEDRVQRGITGESEVKGASFESEWLDLGSCSRNVCKYDTGVDKVDLTLKIVKKNGKTYESQSTLEF
jgi:hypothetical protein